MSAADGRIRCCGAGPTRRTMVAQWAYARVFANSAERTAALDPWLRLVQQAATSRSPETKHPRRSTPRPTGLNNVRGTYI